MRPTNGIVLILLINRIAFSIPAFQFFLVLSVLKQKQKIASKLKVHTFDKCLIWKKIVFPQKFPYFRNPLS